MDSQMCKAPFLVAFYYFKWHILAAITSLTPKAKMEFTRQTSKLHVLIFKLEKKKERIWKSCEFGRKCRKTTTELEGRWLGLVNRKAIILLFWTWPVDTYNMAISALLGTRLGCYQGQSTYSSSNFKLNLAC